MKTLEQLRAERAEIEKAIAAAEEAERIAKGRQEAIQTIALISALKSIMVSLKGREGVLGDVWHDIAPQAYPREGNTAKAFDLSETEVANAKAKGLKAVQNL